MLNGTDANGTTWINGVAQTGTGAASLQPTAGTSLNTGGYALAPAPAAAPTVQAAPAGPSDPNGTANSGPTYADKSNDIALQDAGLSSADAQQSTGLAAVDKALSSLLSQYDTEAGANHKSYQTSSDTNQNNLQTNKETALVNAAQGRRGLFGTLSSLGALSGSGVNLANEAVQRGANEDLTGAGNTFATNQTGLDTAIGTFDQQDKERRDNAATAAGDARTNVQNDTAKNKQSLYSNLANDYAAEGDNANASKFTALASSLYPTLAATSVPSTSLGYTGAAFTAPTLSNYLSGANNTQVATTPTPNNGSGSAALPGLVAAPTKRKTA